MTQALSSNKEHRIDKRTPMTCPVFIHGVSKTGERVKAHTIMDNISQGGLFLQSAQTLKLGSYVFTFTRLLSGAGLAARGKVVRIEKNNNGLSGLAICFSQSRLIPAI